MDKLVGTYLSQEQAPRFPHGWLKTCNLPGYPYYIWVDHKVVGALETKH